MYDFHGKVALVTGGTDGIGRATVRGFAAAGANVLMVGRDAARGQRALTDLAGLRGEIEYYSADVGDVDQVARMVAHCLARFGRLDFGVNNAAASFPLVPTAEIPLAAVDLSLSVDLRGVWACMKHEIEAMLAGGGGAIVNVSSTNGISASPNAGMYSATKHGVNGLTSAAAREYIGKGIRINAVCPGAIETPRRQRRLDHMTPEQQQANNALLSERIPAGRVGTAEEVAAGILWLCSDAASYVIGHHLVIDGGLLA